MKNNNYTMEGGVCILGIGKGCKKKVKSSNGTIKKNTLKQTIIPERKAPEIPNIRNERTEPQKYRSKKKLIKNRKINKNTLIFIFF